MPNPASKIIDWADLSDDPDYDEVVVFNDPDKLEKADRINTRNAYPLPKVQATKTAALDTYVKLEVGQNVKAPDRELELIQSAVLDSKTPSLPFLKLIPKVTHKESVDAAKAAIELVGNANAKY